MNDRNRALAINAFAQEKVTLSLAYVDITGDLIAGLMLSQIMYYWFSPSNNKQSEITVKKGEEWLVKSRKEWCNELRLTPKRCDRAFNILCDMNLIEKKLYKFNGVPTLHIRPVWDEINHAINERW